MFKEECKLNSNMSVQVLHSRNFVIQLTNLTDYGYIESILRELHEANINENDQLTIYISCPGGDMELTLHFINSIVLLFGSNISTIISSFAYSAAAFVFMVGTHRYVFDESSLMIHTYSGYVEGKSGDIKNDVQFTLKWYEKLLKKYFEKYLTEEELILIEHGKDTYFDAEEMLKRGIATNHIKISLVNEEEEK